MKVHYLEIVATDVDAVCAGFCERDAGDRSSTPL